MSHLLSFSLEQSTGTMSTSHGGHKADSNGLSRLGCALATQLQLTAAKTSGTLATLTHRLSRHAANGKFICEISHLLSASGSCLSTSRYISYCE